MSPARIRWAPQEAQEEQEAEGVVPGDRWMGLGRGVKGPIAARLMSQAVRRLGAIP